MVNSFRLSESKLNVPTEQNKANATDRIQHSRMGMLIRKLEEQCTEINQKL